LERLRRRSVGDSSSSGRWARGREFLSRRLTVKRHRKPEAVVDLLPPLQRHGGLIEAREVVPIPKLLGINPVAALDLAVLFRMPRLNVPMPDAGLLHGQGDGQRGLGAVVRLQAADGKWKLAPDLPEELEAAELVMPGIQPEHAQSRAIVQGGVLKATCGERS
jgi:hypothetical protein